MPASSNVAHAISIKMTNISFCRIYLPQDGQRHGEQVKGKLEGQATAMMGVMILNLGNSLPI